MSFYSLRSNSNLGRLDGLSDERDRADAGRIHDLMSVALGPSRTDTASSGFKRLVLQDYWERPRVRGLRGLTPRSTGRYYMLLPWSEKAFLTFKIARANGAESLSGLVLEHVAPLSALWDHLAEGLKDPADDREDWIRHARGTLFNFYRLAVLTKDEAAAIDCARIGIGDNRSRALRNFMPGWVVSDPFVRYWVAQEQVQSVGVEPSSQPPANLSESLAEMEARLTRTQFDVDRFIVPGPTNGPTVLFDHAV